MTTRCRRDTKLKLGKSKRRRWCLAAWLVAWQRRTATQSHEGCRTLGIRAGCTTSPSSVYPRYPRRAPLRHRDRLAASTFTIYRRVMRTPFIWLIKATIIAVCSIREKCTATWSRLRTKLRRHQPLPNSLWPMIITTITVISRSLHLTSQAVPIDLPTNRRSN